MSDLNKEKFIESYRATWETASNICDVLKALEAMMKTDASERLVFNTQARCGLEYLFGLLSEKLFWGAVEPMLTREELKELLGLSPESEGGDNE